MKGADQALTEYFPQAKQQRCLVHIDNNIEKHVRVNDRKEDAYDFKKIYQQVTRAEAEQELQHFASKWRKPYSRLMTNLEKQPHLFTFLDFPVSIRGSIYANNLIEGYNKQIKRMVKKKVQFPNEESLERFIVTQFLLIMTTTAIAVTVVLPSAAMILNPDLTNSVHL